MILLVCNDIHTVAKGCKMAYKLHCGDCLDYLPTLADNSVDAIVTDPPYGLSFMGKAWDRNVPSADVWREALRVLKPGGYLLAFGGARTYHRLAVNIEDAGFEIRDQIQWLYGSGKPASTNYLKPASEPVCMARKPPVGTVADNREAWGTGPINVDACRVGDEERYNPPAGNKAGGFSLNMSVKGMPKGVAGRVAHGRWPANVIHDGSEAVLSAFPVTSSGKMRAGVERSNRGGYTGPMPETTGAETYGDAGSAARFFYCAKPSPSEKHAGLDGGKNDHPTVKPIALTRYLCRLVTPAGGIVLDPFCGSGAIGIGAILEGFGYIGIDLDCGHIKTAAARLAHWSKGA